MVKLMREKIEQCPPLEELSPVTREWETAYSDFLGLPYHWQETALWAKVETTLSEVADLDTAIPDGDSHTSPRLHSTAEVKGYEIHALDGIIGHVHDFLLDDTTWRIMALAINTRNWLPGGRNVVVHEESIDSVCIEDKFVKLTLTTEAIGSLPEYDPDEFKDPDYELHRS